ncbi:MAG: low molecular weight protein-tyrosine phosphatase [Subtercola sp.]|nr:low molecular weight protein-tyrosine phosphatase [Subtercola sp.]
MTEFPPLNILFICTGNICRSPMAVQLLLTSLSAVSEGAETGYPVWVQSRGTHARVGSPMDPPAARQSEAMGGDPTSHEAAQLVQADLRDADLVVAMTLDHRAAAARMLPAASKKSVTLLELKRLIEYLEPGTGGAAGRRASPQDSLAALLASRSSVPPARHEDDLSIPDPFKRSAGAHAKVAREIQAAVATLTGWLVAVLPVFEAGPPPVREARGDVEPERRAVVEPAAAPEPVPVAELGPVAELEPVAEPEPEPITEPISVVAPEPMVGPVALPVPEPVALPAPVPAPVLAVGLAPEAPLTRRQLRSQPGTEQTLRVPLTRREARVLQERELAEHASVQDEHSRQPDRKSERVTGEHIGREVHAEKHSTGAHSQHGEHARQPEPR